MLVAEALTIAAVLSALLVAAWDRLCLSFRPCPADKVLVIRGRSNDVSAGSGRGAGGAVPGEDYVRIARSQTWINPLPQQVAVLALHPVNCHIGARLPLGAFSSTGAPSLKPLYTQLRLMVAPGDDGTSLSRAAAHFAGLDASATSVKLQTLTRELKVPSHLVPPSASGLSDFNLKSNAGWNEWVTSIFKSYGLIVKSWSALEVSQTADLHTLPRRTFYDPAAGATSSLEADLSLACLDLDFDQIGENGYALDSSGF
jgi:hypothetical protein